MQKIFMRLAVLVALSVFSISPWAAPQFLNFPANGYGPFSPGKIASVLDHNVPHNLNQTYLPFQSLTTTGPYGYDGAVLSFTGELFVATPSYPTQNLGCYPKQANAHQTSTWSATLQQVYLGTSGCTMGTALNYDNHPGYDYLIPSGTAVHPAYGGHIVYTKCIKTFSNSTASNICEQYGAVAVDHENGFVTQYLHMSNVYYGAAANGNNQTVSTGTTLGYVSNVSPTYVGPHLHFEVLQRRVPAVNVNSYYDRSNYVVVDPYGYKTSSWYADQLLSKPGCLWAVGCQY